MHKGGRKGEIQAYFHLFVTKIYSKLINCYKNYALPCRYLLKIVCLTWCAVAKSYSWHIIKIIVICGDNI